jgi:hypothetical protein
MRTEHGRRGLTFAGLIAHNVGGKALRLALAALTVGVGVMTVVTFNIVNHSLRTSALSIMQTGRADFTVAQKGVSDLLNSNIARVAAAADRTVHMRDGVVVAAG